MIRALGYAGFVSAAIDDWRQFGTEVLGLQEAPIGSGPDAAAAGVAFRMDERAARIFVERGDREGVSFLGWEVDGPAELEAVHAQLLAAGCAVAAATDETRAARRVEGLLQCVDPCGIAAEFFYGPQLAGEGFQPGRPMEGFKTGSLGLGHVVLQVDDIDVGLRYYRDVLGFRLSDQLEDRLYFLRCNARHHTIGLARLGGAARVLHIMIEVLSFEDVGRALDLALDRGLDVTMLGLHTNDRMTSFYVRTPSGFEIEYGWNGLLVDDETWSEKRIERPSIWGHRQIDTQHPPGPRPFQKLREAEAAGASET